MAYRALLVFSFLFSWSCGIAQRNERDQATIAGDTNRVNALIEETYKLRETNPVKAMEYCLMAINLAKQLEYRKGQGRALGSLGWVYFRKGEYLKALEISYEALKISEQIG